MVPLLLGPAMVASAQPPQTPEFTGRFSFGARGVDVDGSRTKYREDINLDDGPRIFDIGLSFAPAGADRAVDRIDLDLTSLGGEPYESLHFAAQKYGAYKLEVDRRRSEYFYQDTILPAALASLTASTGGDFHHFDFERTMDTARLDITAAPATRLNIALERFTKQGESTTTLDIERDEFEIDSSIDESSGVFSVGVEHDWDRLTLVAEQRIGDYENATDLFLPGYSTGAATTDLAELQFFDASQPYDYESMASSLRLLARPSERLLVQGGWSRQDLDLAMDAIESASGTSFLGLPFTTSSSGTADLSRDIERVDLEAGYQINQRFRVVVGAKETTLEQLGDLVFGAEVGASSWSIETRGLEARLDVALSSAILLGAGWSTERRDVEYGQDLVTDPPRLMNNTERDGFFLSLSFDPVGPLSVSASIEDDSIDDPFTLKAPTAGRRYRVHGRYRWDNGLTLTASYRRNNLDNDLSGWAGETEQADLRLGYSTESVQLAAGAGRVDYSRRIDQLVTGGTRQDLFAIDYAAEARFLDTSFRWQLAAKVAIGAYARAYDNDGSYPLERDDWRGFVEVDLGDGYHLQIARRSLDYVEDGFDDFDAELVELAVGFRW